MDVIRDSAFFTTLLHCALAYSLYPYDLVQKPAYELSSIPGSGILQTPSYNRAPEVFVTPSWQNRPEENTGLQASKNPLYLFKTLGLTLRNDGTQYPLNMPAKLNIVANNGEVPVMNPGVFSQNGAPAKNIQNTPSYLTELSGEGNRKLLDLGCHRTNLGTYPCLSGAGVKPADIDPPTNPGLYYNVPGKVAPTQSYQEMQGFVLKPAGLIYPAAPGSYGKEVFPYTPYKPDQYGAVKSPDYNVTPVTKPVTPEYKNVVVSDLPPVPTPPLPPLQRIRIALMNTVAGLPGGSPELLNSIRAR